MLLTSDYYITFTNICVLDFAHRIAFKIHTRFYNFESILSSYRYECADSLGQAAYGVGQLLFDCWNRGFEYR